MLENEYVSYRVDDGEYCLVFPQHCYSRHDIVQSAYTNTLCLAMTTLTPFSFSLEKVDSIPFTGWTTALSAEAYNACRERSSSPFEDYADRNLGSLRILHVQCLLAVA